MPDPFAYLGAGVLVPFRRDGKDDFANDTGLEAVKSSLRIVLGTLCAGPTNDGEVPFNQELGTLIRLLRHRNINDPTTEEIANHYVLSAILANEPRVRMKGIGFVPKPDANTIILRLKYDVVDRDTTGLNVVAPDVEQEIEV